MIASQVPKEEPRLCARNWQLVSLLVIANLVVEVIAEVLVSAMFSTDWLFLSSGDPDDGYFYPEDFKPVARKKEIGFWRTDSPD